MPSQAPSRFQAWEFTDQENRSASSFNDLQYKKLQTIQCNIAEQIMNIDCSTKEAIAEAEIQRAFLKGQLEMLQHLLDMSNAMSLQINDEAYESQQVAMAAQNQSGPNLYQQFYEHETKPSQE
jgi:hypothetical protein